MANILVVDDEIGIRELLSEILGDEGHVVHLAENAAQARQFRQGDAPDLVLLDIWMPDTDGVTLLKEWASVGALTMPVIMMSGHATIDTAVEATRIGAIDFLEKPIALQKLLRAVQKGLERGVGVLRHAVTNKPALATFPLDMGDGEGSNGSLAGGAPGAGGDRPAGTLLRSEMPLDLPLREARDAFERAYFEYHLSQENGSMTRVAEKTGLERTHLYRKLKQLGIELNKAGRK
ncbi:MAG: response regulator [Burkholderiaceae bacterium]|jgi:DNA-binding NtrC family response regulator